ncbi:unnamed protein product [Pleuronectes platessa]|uniref:LisH domain-containing protein n=1 Tax=Pleuronectes platessa TaxID=8262 RepID=A0A9N7Z8X5_PLEPL|nr:unnamed protein product [Pleuronectes platessa]
MYAKGKGAVVPSDSQAREKLALYVYEYLLHVGAQKSAQTFLSEIRWEKNITLGEPPGFLHSWWWPRTRKSNWKSKRGEQRGEKEKAGQLGRMETKRQTGRQTGSLRR